MAKADGASPCDEVEAVKARFAALRPEGKVPGGNRRCDRRPVHAPGAPGCRPAGRDVSQDRRQFRHPAVADGKGRHREAVGRRQAAEGSCLGDGRDRDLRRRPVRRRSGRPVSLFGQTRGCRRKALAAKGTPFGAGCPSFSRSSVGSGLRASAEHRPPRRHRPCGTGAVTRVSRQRAFVRARRA